MSERLTKPPLFIEIAESLKEQGTFRRDFSESEVVGIMSGVVTSLVSSPEAKDQAVVVGGVDNMEVKIRGQRGTVSGNVQVYKPMEVKIPVKFVLKNSTDPENLKLDQISIGSGFTKLAIAALGKVLGVDIEAEAKEKLKDPNAALAEAFSAELSPQGVKLTGVGLHFKDNVLSVLLKGNSVNQPKLPKASEQAKSTAPVVEASPADKEWMRKRGRVRRYLESGNGMDFLKRTYKDDLWAHIGVDGSVKQTYGPLNGVLAEEGLCLRENVREDIRPAYASASELRRETKFLESVKGPHFVRVYARAPYDKSDSAGFGQYRDDSHWELVDFADGTVVDRKFDREHDGSYWPDELTPAVRLRVLLAACENEFEALSLSRPVYIADLKTDAFILGKDGETIKQVDCQIHDESVDFSHQIIATELVRLCLELFPAKANFSSTDIEKAIGWYFSPERYANEKKWFMHGENPPILTEIISLSRHNMPIGLDAEILGFLNNIRDGNRKVNQVPMNLFNRILPIAQRTEREESQARAEKLAAVKRKEIKQRALEKEPRTWEKEVGEMIKSPYFTTVFESTGSAIAAGAAYQMREGIVKGIIDKPTYLSRVNQAAKLMLERKRGASRRVRSDIRQLTKELAADKVAEMAYNNTKSPVAAVAGYELSQEIMSNAIGKAEFVNLVKLINALISGK